MPRESSSTLRRTEWAERHVEDFLAMPLVREFVFRSPQSLDNTIQKEVVDFLISYGNTTILVSQKCQEDPSVRTGAKAIAWARKAAKRAASQLCGALHAADSKPIWCEHSRRGRVEFPDGLPQIDYAIAIIEVFERVSLEPDAGSLPLTFRGTAIAYFSVNDFLNLIVNLRTTSELLEYLNVRSSLPASDLRVIGDERSLFECYLLEGASLDGAPSRAQAAAAVKNQPDRLRAAIATRREANFYSALLERVADALATRLPGYAASTPEPLLTHFDPPEARVNYLTLQNILAGLRLGERVELGRVFRSLKLKLRSEVKGFIYQSIRLDSKPDLVFVFASSKGIERALVVTHMNKLMAGAMAF